MLPLPPQPPPQPAKQNRKSMMIHQAPFPPHISSQFLLPLLPPVAAAISERL
nr:MAG TPA: hypothetical protein [Caudoviricetes sp.]